MKKVGIITLNGYLNYGNRLQNYALQETLKTIGCEVETILIDSNSINLDLKNKITKIKERSATEIFFRICDYIKKRTNYKNIKESNWYRIGVFKEFTKKYITESDYYLSERNIVNGTQYFDYFIVGSDQVWNPYSIEHSPSTYFLDFIENDKRISYAASFGISEIPERYKNQYKNWINNMNKLSVREISGADIIKDLTGRDAEVHLDPTFLLNKQDWLKISKKAKNRPQEEYLLTYFLGGVPKEHKKNILNFAKLYNLKVVNLADINDLESYKTGPSEFIDYINNCKVFCTDSFHGAVFSILFEKPFIIYERKGVVSMYSRINTLLEKFRLESRKEENIQYNNAIFDVDYSHVYPILIYEREKSLKYLIDALNLKENKNDK